MIKFPVKMVVSNVNNIKPRDPINISPDIKFNENRFGYSALFELQTKFQFQLFLHQRNSKNVQFQGTRHQCLNPLFYKLKKKYKKTKHRVELVQDPFFQSLEYNKYPVPDGKSPNFLHRLGTTA